MKNLLWQSREPTHCWRFLARQTSPLKDEQLKVGLQRYCSIRVFTSKAVNQFVWTIISYTPYLFWGTLPCALLPPFEILPVHHPSALLKFLTSQLRPPISCKERFKQCICRLWGKMNPSFCYIKLKSKRIFLDVLIIFATFQVRRPLQKSWTDVKIAATQNTNSMVWWLCSLWWWKYW